MCVYRDVCACVCVSIHTKWLLNKLELVVNSEMHHSQYISSRVYLLRTGPI